MQGTALPALVKWSGWSFVYLPQPVSDPPHKSLSIRCAIIVSYTETRVQTLSYMKYHPFTLRQIPRLFIYSLILLPVFFFVYTLVKSPIISYISIIMVLYIAWKQGIIAGFILSMFNIAVLEFTFRFNAPAINAPSAHEAVIGIFIHIVSVLVAGYVGSLARRLKAEVEERKRVEILLNEHREQLEQRVEERTRELENATMMLHQAEKMETLGHLAGGLAHDFKNHLTIIVGYANLLIKKISVNTLESEYLKHILTSSERATELTTTLMNFSRKERYIPQPLNINDVVTQTVTLFSKSLFSNISIQCITAPDLPLMFGGKSQIQNAVINLALNSKDSISSNGHIVIETKLMPLTEQHLFDYNVSCDSGLYIGISVSDNGCGISPDILPHVFEPFFTTKPEGKGTGMGLATIQGMTRQHHGDVFAVSEMGKGTSFTMIFPVLPHLSE